MSTVFEKLAAGQNAFSVREQVGAFVIEYPLGAREPTAILAHAPFWQLQNSYSRPVWNATVSVNNVTAYFVDDTNFRDVGGGLWEFTGYYASIPNTYTTFESFAYTYPGYAAALAAPGRVPITQQITSKLTVEHFLVGTGQTYTSADQIPVYFAQEYAYGPLTGNVAATYLSTESTPTLANYKAWANTDASTVNSYSIEATDSTLDVYAGSIWKRTRRAVKAR